MKAQTVIAQTSKGHRIFLENIGRVGQRYDIIYADNHITVHFTATGKRKVVASKGGVIDIEGKKVSAWKRTTDTVAITYADNSITIARV